MPRNTVDTVYLSHPYPRDTGRLHGPVDEAGTNAWHMGQGHAAAIMGPVAAASLTIPPLGVRAARAIRFRDEQWSTLVGLGRRT